MDPENWCNLSLFPRRDVSHVFFFDTGDDDAPTVVTLADHSGDHSKHQQVQEKAESSSEAAPSRMSWMLPPPSWSFKTICGCHLVFLLFFFSLTSNFAKEFLLFCPIFLKAIPRKCEIGKFITPLPYSPSAVAICKLIQESSLSPILPPCSRPKAPSTIDLPTKTARTSLV